MPSTLHDPARNHQDLHAPVCSLPEPRPRTYYRPQPARRRAWRYTCPTRGGQSWQAPADAALDATPLTPRDPVWSSRKRWLHALTIAARHLAGGRSSITITEGKQTAHVRVDTLLDVAWEDAATADSRTGRNVRTSHATVAKQLGCSPRTARRCRTLIETMGYARTVQQGRYLTSSERSDAYRSSRRCQRRMASNRALVMPPTPAQQTEKGHLPCKGQFPCLLTSVGSHLARVTRAGRGSRRPSQRRSNETGADEPRYSLRIQRLAAQLVRELPSLAPKAPITETRRSGHHIGQVCRVLVDVGVDPDQWSAADLKDALDRRNRTLGLDSLRRGQQRSPMGLLAHQLREVLRTTPEGPAVARRLAQEALEAERRASDAEKARLAAEVAHFLTTGRAATLAAAARANSRPARLAAAEAQRATKHSPIILDAGPRAARNRF